MVHACVAMRFGRQPGALILRGSPGSDPKSIASGTPVSPAYARALDHTESTSAAHSPRRVAWSTLAWPSDAPRASSILDGESEIAHSRFESEITDSRLAVGGRRGRRTVIQNLESQIRVASGIGVGSADPTYALACKLQVCRRAKGVEVVHVRNGQGSAAFSV